LEQAKSTVLSSLTSASGQRTYDHAIREFLGWYCSEPRLAFNRTVVQRYRIHLEQRQYAPATINLRLAAVRRVAYEAADAGLLSPELAAGIRRVKGVRRLGVRLGNWLSPEQGRRLLEHDGPTTPRHARDHAMLAMLIGCGLRRGEPLGLAMESVQQREDHRVTVDLVGKGGHVRTVPIPSWVKLAVDAWTKAAGITEGPCLPGDQQGRARLGRRDVAQGALGCRSGSGPARGHREPGTPRSSSDMRPVVSPRRRRTRANPVSLGPRVRSDDGTLPGCKQKLRCAVNDQLGIEPDAAA
jgi:site-specific recombinase XerC